VDEFIVGGGIEEGLVVIGKIENSKSLVIVRGSYEKEDAKIPQTGNYQRDDPWMHEITRGCLLILDQKRHAAAAILIPASLLLQLLTLTSASSTYSFTSMLSRRDNSVSSARMQYVSTTIKLLFHLCLWTSNRQL